LSLLKISKVGIESVQKERKTCESTEVNRKTAREGGFLFVDVYLGDMEENNTNNKREVAGLIILGSALFLFCLVLLIYIGMTGPSSWWVTAALIVFGWLGIILVAFGINQTFFVQTKKESIRQEENVSLENQGPTKKSAKYFLRLALLTFLGAGGVGFGSFYILKITQAQYPLDLPLLFLASFSPFVAFFCPILFIFLAILRYAEK
jgi:hypothetical protein